jgi:hypothetical protein
MEIAPDKWAGRSVQWPVIPGAHASDGMTVPAIAQFQRRERGNMAAALRKATQIPTRKSLTGM